MATDVNGTQKRETVNLLLIGEAGVGKSTFINAFMNYLTLNTLEDAEKAKTIHSLKPLNFTVTDDNFQIHRIQFGKDDNESLASELGISNTHSTKSYTFDAAGVRMRLIDTPSIVDMGDFRKNAENCDKLLTMIDELKDIHGICILMKSNSVRLTPLFEYCVKQILTKLKDAMNNVMFLFTNSRSTFYRPGDVIPLKTILNEIKSKPPFIDVPFTKDNVFCVDNEAFRFLIAKRDNIQFDDDTKENFSKSWTKSASVSVQLVKYLKSLKPYKIQETASLKNTRRLILTLSQTLGEMAEHIKNNISSNELYKALLIDKMKDIEGLKKNLMIPMIGLKVITLPHPMTVCTNSKCVEAIKVEDSTKKNYKQICHDHCSLSGVQREVIGDPQLRYCSAMIDKDGTRKCKHALCGHSYLEHMQIYYKTEPYNYTEEDKNVAKNIDKNKSDMKDINDKITALDKSNAEYENEIKFIQNSTAKFAHFVKNNMITAYNDTYKEYLEYLIDREKRQDNGGDKAFVKYFETLLNIYEGYKNILETELTKAQQADPNLKAVVSATEINQLVEDLYKLPLSGKTIKDLFRARSEECCDGEDFN